MCGICGMIGTNITETEYDAWKELLILNQFRGMDATGVFTVSEKSWLPSMVGKSRVDWFKDNFEASYFLTTDDKKGWKKRVLDRKDKVAFVGHCRAATVGNHVPKNAHPFEFTNVLGVHNGTLSGEYPGKKAYETDSEALYATINDIGIEAALKELDPGSAYSLVFFDKVQNTLNFIRNEARPMHFAYAFAKSTLYFSSEKRALEFVSATEGPINMESVFSLKPHILMTIDLDGRLPNNITTKEINVKKYTPSWHAEYGDWWDQYEKEHGEKYPDRKALPLSSTAEDLELEYDDKFKCHVPKRGVSAPGTPYHQLPPWIKEKTFYHGFKGKQLSRDKWLDVLAEGCALCGIDPDITDPDLEYHVGWATSDRFVCQGCMAGDPWVMKHFVEYRVLKPTEPEEKAEEVPDLNDNIPDLSQTKH